MVDVKRIYSYIFVIIVILFLMVPLFKEKKDINPLNNDGVVLSFDGFKSVDTLDDESYNLAKGELINIKNTTDEDKDYNLYYVVSKNSTANVKNITIVIDDKIYHLNSLSYNEDNNNYYFYIDNNNLNANEEINMITRIYSSDTDGYLTSSFVLL